MSAIDPKFTFINSIQTLNQCIERLKNESIIALDVEGSSLYSYKDKVCLVQIGTFSEVFLIDTLSPIDVKLLFQVISEKFLVLHGADYDLRMLYMHYKFVPKNGIFDTMLAAELVGSEALSLAALVEENFQVVMSKSSQKSDWAKRPLTEKQLVYAAYDVIYLIDIYKKLSQKLIELQRESWHKEWCEKIIKVVKIQKEKEDVWRIKGAGVLSQKELNYLKYLWTWRDKEAVKQDRPSFKIMSNQFMLHFSQIAAQCSDKIKKNSFEIPKNIHKMHVDEISKVLLEASKIPSNQWPARKKGAPAIETINKKRLSDIKSLVRKKAKELNLRASLIVSNADLTEFLKVKKISGSAEAYQQVGLMKWQKKLLKDILEEN